MGQAKVNWALSGSRYGLDSVEMSVLLPFLRAVLAEEGGYWLPLEGFSMWPTIGPQASIHLRPIEDGPKVGDILVFLVENQLWAHRCVELLEDGRFLARGDGAERSDPLCGQEAILGRVDRAVWKGGHWPGRFPGLLDSRWLLRHRLGRLWQRLLSGGGLR